MSEILVAVLIFFSTCVFLFLKNKNVTKNLPPGPLGLPVVGYLPFIDSKAPYKTFSSLVDRYGPIFSIRLGSVLGIVVADPKVIKKVLQMDETTARAPLYLTHGIMKGYGIIGAGGELWKEHRKFVLSFMRRNGMKANQNNDQLRFKLENAAEEFLQCVSVCPPEGVDAREYLLHCVGNVMNLLVFGKTYQEKDPKWKWLRGLLTEGVKLIGISGPLNFLPFLRILPKFKRVIEFIRSNQKKTHQEYKTIISNLEANLDLNSDFEDSQQPCLMEEYIKKSQHPSNDEEIWCEEQTLHVAADMFGSGSETTITTITWHLLFLALHPDIQENIRDEVLGLHDCYYETVFSSNTTRIPLSVAALKESMRLSSIIPLGIPHGVREDITVDGFVFPKGSMIMPFLWHVHRNPDHWKDPLQYNPRRFLDEENQVQNDHALLPFQTGKRVCIGEDFAKHVSLFFTTKIIQKFRISLPEGEENKDPTEDAVCGISLTPKPFKLIYTAL